MKGRGKEEVRKGGQGTPVVMKPKRKKATFLHSECESMTPSYQSTLTQRETTCKRGAFSHAIPLATKESHMCENRHTLTPAHLLPRGHDSSPVIIPRITMLNSVSQTNEPLCVYDLVENLFFFN